MDEITVRFARLEDSLQLLTIYTPYVLKTPITFEYLVPTLDEFTKRVETISETYPYLVALEHDQIIGYAYASSFKGRAAYDWSVETSIYIDESKQHLGVGRLLYTKLESLLKKQNVRTLCACITFPNPKSIAFHQTFHYEVVAHFHKSGFKFNAWHDMIWMEKSILPYTCPPEPFLSISNFQKEAL